MRFVSLVALLSLAACAETPPASAPAPATVGGFAGKADDVGAARPYGGPDAARWQTEAVLANAARAALAAAPAGALVSIPTRLHDTGDRPFGDGQTNAVARMEAWSAPRPPLVATLLPATGEVRFALDRTLVADALVVDYGLSEAQPAPTGSVTLPLAADADGDRHATWTLPAGVDFAAAVSEGWALVRPAGWRDAFPLRFRFPRHGVDEMVASVPADRRAANLIDPAGIAGTNPGAEALPGHAGPFRNERVHAGAGEAVTAVGGARAWTRANPFKQLYLCLDGRDHAAEAAAGVPSGAGWHVIGDPAETLLNTLEDGALLAGWASESPPAAFDAALGDGGAAYGLTEVATFGWLRPGEALVTGRRDASRVFHWFAADEAPRCLEVWVHECRPGADMTFACAGRPVRFEAEVRTAWGERAVLVGDHPALGGWDVARGVAMDPVAWPLWAATVELPPGETVRFKVVTVGADGSVTWPAGPDQVLTAPR